MKYVLDTHTHTLASGHAYNTMNEMIASASKKGLELLCITEHAPSMPGSCGGIYFQNLRVCRREKSGIRVMYGVELNIMDFEGNIDLDSQLLKQLDLRIASLHFPCCAPGNAEENTNAYIQAMKNPLIDIIGHPDDNRYPIYYERLVKAAKSHRIMLEINNSSLLPTSFRAGAKENDKILLNLCREYEVPIAIGSDAHVEEEVGNFSCADELICEMGFPEELIANTSVEKFEKYLDARRSSC